MARKPQKKAQKPQRSQEPQLYFGRQGIRLAGAIFSFLGVLVLATAPFVIGRARVLLMVLIAAFGLASLVLAAGLWWRRPWAVPAFAGWGVAAVCLQVLFQLATRMVSWGPFVVAEVVFVVVLVQIGRYLAHDLRLLAGERRGGGR